ncbi:MAG: 30S ribosomal protein S12 methylthiotransferase RimO [Planctomycetota bacterium]
MPPAAPTESAADHDVQTVAFVSLGCPKNLVDSEKMLGLLAEDGITPVDADAIEAGEADAVVINTCGFLEASKAESVEEVRRAVEAKQAGLTKRVVVAGCLVQRHRARLLEWVPEIDAMIGVYDRDRIVPAVRPPQQDKPIGSDVAVELPVYSSIAASARLAKRAREIDDAEHRGYFESDAARLRLTPRHYAYLRMSEGCNQNCAFCTIPSIRGAMRSKPIDAITAELRELMSDGAFEINLIGQDTTSYGQDIGYGGGLAGLLESLHDTATEFGGGWLRLMYAYPSRFTDEMIDAIARLRHVVPYIDMPLQHIADPVLDGMRRKTSADLIRRLLDKLHDRVPGMAIRTTFISGFPGETQADHDELVRFVEEQEFEAMGVFPYSPEPGTPAGRMHGQAGMAVPEDVIADRIDELMLAQQQVVFDRNADMAETGAEFDVLIDGEAEVALSGEDGDEPTHETVYAGRTYRQAPDIDATTYVRSMNALSPGELVRCRVTAWADYDLVAQPVDELDRRISLPMA